MSRDHDGHAGVVLTAFILGGITGAAVALLSTPASGSDARRYLGEKIRENRAKAEVAGREGREFVQRQSEHLSAAIDRGREAYQRAREEQPVEDEV